MARYRFLIVDATPGGSGVGNPLCEVPFTNVSFSTLLSGVGSFTGTLPLEHDKSTPSNLKPGNREVTVVRDDVVVWNGPITSLTASLESRQITITAREAHWYLSKRTVEVNKAYAAVDLFDIVRDLITVATAKTGGSLYRFSASAGLSGVTKTWSFSGYGRRNVGQTIADLASEDFDFRLIYTGSTRQQVTRVLQLGAPTLGSTITNYKLEPRNGLSDLTLTEDLDPASNRTHVLGKGGLVHTTANTASTTAGLVLLEHVESRTDIAPVTIIRNIAFDQSRRRKPPVATFVASYKPTTRLPYGWCAVGDTISIKVPTGYFAVNATRRVTEIETRPDTSEGELVSFTFYDPAAV